IVRDFGAHVAECDTVHRTRDASDGLAVEEKLVIRLHRAVDVENAEPTVDLAAVVLACDRLLSWVAPLREADVRFLEACLGRQDPFVELCAPLRTAGLDPPALDVLGARVAARRTLVEHLLAADDEPRLMLLRFDLDLRRKTRPHELRTDNV